MTQWLRLYRDPNAGDSAGAAVAEPPVAAGAIPADLAPKSAAINMPIPDQKPSETPGAFVIPPEYKDKAYLKGVDSPEKLFKMLDGAQELIGKRPAGVPLPDAKPEEWEKFYESVGRPKTAAEYQLDGADKTDPKILPKFQEALHKAGLNPAQAKIVWNESIQALNDYAKEKGIAEQQQNTDFDALGTKLFGAERDKVLATSKTLLDKFAPAELKSELAKLSNENLIILAGVLNNINKTYIKTDVPTNNQPTISGNTPDDIRAEARLLMEKQAKLTPLSQEFENLQKQINAKYDQLRTLKR